MGKAMPREIRRRKAGRIVLGTMLGVFVMAGSAGAAFAADDDNEGWYDQRILRSILRGIGLQNGREGRIEYKERPPLVVPPNRDLPPPDTTGALGPRDPAWPSDPDEAKRKAAKKAESNRKYVDVERWGDAMTPDQMKIGKTGAAPNETGIKPGQTVETSTQLRPDELGYHGSIWSGLTSMGGTFTKDKPPEGAKFLREPNRASLTEPPSGYRTPSPDQPYGLNYKNEKTKSGGDFQTSGTDNR
jgi:hypothetical protein